MKKTLLFFFLALFATSALWAQSGKSPNPSGQINQLFERYKQNQSLSKEEYNQLSPNLSELMQADLSQQSLQNRTIGTGGTPITNLVSTSYTFSQATGTYTPITGGTVLGTGTGVDDNNYTAQPIGFTFNYDGVDYTQIGVNSNGFIWFGTTAPPNNTYTAISTTSAVDRIVAALSGDLRGLASGQLRIQTIGTAPNRECVVQWSNFRHYLGTGDNYNFQIRLREADGRIELHYGAFTKNATNRAYQVGLRGTANTDFNNRTTTTNWSASTAGTVNTATMALTTTVLPANGLIFRFSPPPTTPEVVATNIYTLGKVATPLNNPVPIAVRVANISGTATATVDVTVTIKEDVNNVVRYTSTQTGLTISPLSAITPSFSGWNPTIIENCTVQLDVTETSGNEVDASDNSITFKQVITNNRMSYAEVGVNPTGGVGFNTNTGNFVARFTANPSGNINQVGVNFISSGASYKIGIWDDDGPGGTPGTLLWESTVLTTTTGVNTIPVLPAQSVSGDFFVGIRQTTTTNVGFAYQQESPIRAQAFYFSSPVTSTTWSDFAPTSPFRLMIEPRFQLLNDVGVTAITSPTNNGIFPQSSPIDITADVLNYGSQAQTPDVFYTVNGGPPVGPVSAGTIASGGSATVTFSGANAFVPSSPGTYTIQVYTQHPGDGDNSNDMTTITIRVQPLVTVTNTTPYFEDFEASAGGWFSQAITGTANDWVRGTPAKTNINGAFSGTQAWVTGLTATYQNNQNSAVISPIFDLSALTLDPTVSFRGFMHITDLDWDAGVLEYSTDNGANWTKLGVLQINETDPNASNWYNSSSTNGPIAPPKWSKTDAGYLSVSKTLGGLAGQSSVLIRLRFGSDASINGQGWAFDDFRITPVSGPEISVTGNGNPIVSGSTTTSLANHTDFGFANTSAARLGPNVYPVPIAEIGPLERNVSASSSEGRGEKVSGEEVAGQARMSVKPTETPIANALPGTVVRTFTIANTGVVPLTISGVTITGPNASDFSVTASPANTVAPSGSTTFQVTFNPSSDGVKDATVEIANDDADENPFTFAIRGTGATSLPLPYSASLNGTAPDWTTQVVNAVGTTAIYGLIATGVTLPDGSSGGAVRANFYGASNGRSEVLRTPFIDLSGATNPVLNFHVAYRSFSGQNDRIEVVVSTDGGATYQVGSPVLYDKSRTSTPTLATLPDAIPNFTPTAASDWRHETVDLSQFAGQSDLLIGFRATSAFGNNAWIANVTVQDVSSLTTTNVTGNSTFTGSGITINFTNFGGTGGNLYFSRFNNAPTSEAATEYETNSTATTQDGSIFTPSTIAPRWWTVTYDGQVLAATINYNVSIDITGIPGVNNPDRLYILRRSNRFGSWVALSTTRAGNILTATGLTGFSDFGVGGNNPDNPLPVNLGTFTGRNIPQGVELRWQTASETDNAGFEVRRTELIDGVEQEWLTVATYRTTQALTGHGTTNQAHNYTYIDPSVQVGKTYRYALRSVDLNGTVHDYPQTVSVEVNSLAKKVYTYKLEQNYPNPFNPSTRIVYQVAAASNVKLEVFDMLGRKVATLVNERKEAGEYSVMFNAQGLSSGIYFYRLQTDKFMQTKKLMLVK
ncbi:MAG: choice-of-anchor D domain-containing protein [Chlorobiales bacterium]